MIDINGEGAGLFELVLYQISAGGKILRCAHDRNNTGKDEAEGVGWEGNTAWDRGPESYWVISQVEGHWYHIGTCGKALRACHGRDSTHKHNVEGVGWEGNTDWDLGVESHWRLIPVPDKQGWFQIGTSGKALRAVHGGITTGNDNIEGVGWDCGNVRDISPETHFEFLPVEYRCNAKVGEFQFDEHMLAAAAANAKAAYVFTERFNNKSTVATVQEEFVYSKEHTSTQTFGFAESVSLTFGQKFTVEAEVGFKGIATAKSGHETNLEAGVNLSGSQEFQKRETTKIELKKTITIPAAKSHTEPSIVEATGAFRFATNVEISFTATVAIRATMLYVTNPREWDPFTVMVPIKGLSHILKLAKYEGELE